MALCTKHCTKKAPLLVHLWVHHSRLCFLLHIEAAGWQRLLTLDWLQCLSSVTIAAAHILKIAALIRMRRDFSGFANWWQQGNRRRRRMVDSKWHKKQLQTRQLQDVTREWLVVQCRLTWIWSDSGSGQLPGRGIIHLALAGHVNAVKKTCILPRSS